jgi:hypothetical protein
MTSCIWMRKGKKEEKEVKLNKKSKKRQMRGGKKKPWQQGIAGFAEEDRRYGKGNGSQRVWTTEEESRETEEQGRAGGVVDHEETGGRLWRQNKRKNLKHGKKSRDNFHHQAFTQITAIRSVLSILLWIINYHQGQEGNELAQLILPSEICKAKFSLHCHSTSLRTPQTPKKNLFSRIFSSSSRSSGTVEGRDEEMELPTIETPSEIQGPGLSNWMGPREVQRWKGRYHIVPRKEGGMWKCFKLVVSAQSNKL